MGSFKDLILQKIDTAKLDEAQESRVMSILSNYSNVCSSVEELSNAIDLVIGCVLDTDRQLKIVSHKLREQNRQHVIDLEKLENNNKKLKQALRSALLASGYSEEDLNDIMSNLLA